MDQKTFGMRMVAIDRALRSGDPRTALRDATRLREDLGAEHIIDAAKFCWPLYYELRALHALARWGDAVDLLEDHGVVVTALRPHQHAHAAELAMEATVRAGRPDLLTQWVKTFLFARQRGPGGPGYHQSMEIILGWVDRAGVPALQGLAWDALAVAAERGGHHVLADAAREHVVALGRRRVA